MKKRKEIELDFDFTVDPRPLIKEEQKAISNFIRAKKDKRKKMKLRNKAIPKNKSSHQT